MDANLIWVLVGCALIGAGASAVGCYAFLRKQALVGDAVAHSLLPGVALSFILFQEKSFWVLFPGAFIAGWLGLISIDAIGKHTKLKSDTAIAIVLSVFFALGIVLLTHIQQSDYGNQTGLDNFLFGKAASMLPADILLFGVVDMVLIAVILLLYPYLKLFSFDPEFALASGLPVRFLTFVLSSLTVLAVATGIQAVGVVLMAALIITPAAAARFLTRRLSSMMLLAIGFGMISALAGVYISNWAPSMPTGPWIVIVLSFIAVATFFFAPKKGIYQRFSRRKEHQKKIQEENLLKLLFYFDNEHGKGRYSRTDFMRTRQFESSGLQNAIKSLLKKEWIDKEHDRYSLTRKGKNEATRVVRLHRLWELYLNERMNIAADHVHHDAEAIEHVITPDLEKALLKELGYPELDPHKSVIPGVKELKR